MHQLVNHYIIIIRPEWQFVQEFAAKDVKLPLSKHYIVLLNTVLRYVL